MTSFEALYDRNCRSSVCWSEVAPMKGVLRFEKKEKLSPRFLRPFKILERISPIAYRLALTPSFFAVHDVFHDFMLRKYVADPTHVVDFEPMQINEHLSYEKQPVEILLNSSHLKASFFVKAHVARFPLSVVEGSSHFIFILCQSQASYIECHLSCVP
ncbi:ABC transporter B family member 19-like [Cucumis melo var. makuwa]|uniref:ABC transporter B family member 19-like n=1 Tax=Cucumis melo var. makuwa TaxID=1194695 RepID=A0A5D3C8F3_CUCMM|nr:ABC transporter B family member 19-like [Cucumis melo var. makuwa]TYK07620.1 ABC transporter B family member 19-like [Cucumis melo var. makuwa]